MKYDHPELNDTKIIRLIVDDRFKLLRHILLLFGTLIIISFAREITQYTGVYRYFRLLCIYGALISMCYINMNVLAPRFFFKGRYIQYLALLFLLVAIFILLLSYLLKAFFISPELNSCWQKSNDRAGIYEGMIMLTPIILTTTMIKLIQRWMRDSERITALRNITLTMELNELRNQINPHFLFNMLNGIRALVHSDTEKADIVIMKLSEFLRYQLYENNEEKTLLISEINFLSNFLDLEKLRRDNLSVSIERHTDTSILHRIFLPPNLFTTFVENAIKHSVNISGAASYIRINIAVNDDKIYFYCVNSTDPGYIPSEEKSSGLGLANIKRRLALLYGNNYVLEIASTANEYIVKLTIPI
ncbi:sensor histidine kinase [Chitinophaga sp. RAB17]|uniref:sensor histidine kinase n=1 Tax=Chitinophaga sp. RAB17 TaxID=3233049 RepID=UPI003F8F0B4C